VELSDILSIELLLSYSFICFNIFIKCTSFLTFIYCMGGQEMVDQELNENKVIRMIAGKRIVKLPPKTGTFGKLME